MSLDLVRIRSEFRALDADLAYFDSPGGTQTPEPVVQAISRTLSGPLSNRGTDNLAQRNADLVVAQARQAVADLTGADPAGVVFGRSATQLTFDFARTLARGWSAGDEVVVTRLDHDANIRPWVLAAQERGVTVRWVDFDPSTGELAPERVAAVLSERTRLVALTAASSAIGTCPEVAEISHRAHAVGAMVYVDASHAAPHMYLDRTALGADFVALSASKWCGPHVGAVVADPQLLAHLHPDKLRSTPDKVPERFEAGAAPYELYAGVSAAVDHWAALSGETAGSRRDRLRASMGAVARYEGELFGWLDDALRAMRHVQVLGRPERTTPTLAFRVEGMRPRQVAVELNRQGICVWDGDAYARELFDAFGVTEDGGAVRLGLMHYNTPDEVGQVIDAVAALRPRPR